MADIINPDDQRQEKLFSLYIELAQEAGNPARTNITQELIQNTIGSLENHPIKRGDVAPVSVEEILRRQEEEPSFSEKINQIGLREFYDGYNDFIIAVKNTLVNDGKVDDSVFKIQTVVSPGLEAYEPTGFNKLDITPHLSSYAHVL